MNRIVLDRIMYFGFVILFIFVVFYAAVNSKPNLNEIRIYCSDITDRVDLEKNWQHYTTGKFHKEEVLRVLRLVNSKNIPISICLDKNLPNFWIKVE